MEGSTTAGVAGMVAGDEVGRMPRLDEFEGEAAGHGSSRGWARSKAGARAHPFVASAGAGTVGVADGVNRGGRRSSVEPGNDVAEGITAGVRHLQHLCELTKRMEARSGPLVHRSLAGDEIRGGAFGRYDDR